MFKFFKNIFFLFFLFVYIPASIFANKAQVQRIYAHMLIHDYGSACQEASYYLNLDPNSEALWKVYIKVLAKNGDERKTMEAWNNFVTRYPQNSDNREVLEAISWGILENASTSSSPIIRTFSALGAFFGQDANGVKIIHKSLKDTNNFMRMITLELASRMQDAILQDEVLKMLREEKVWSVKLEAIKAVGRMNIAAAKNDLVSIISDTKSNAEEKSAAIASLVTMLDTADRKEVISLASSNRAGLRQLACQVVDFFDLYRDLDQIFPLIYDINAEVRAAAIKVIGNLRVKEFQGKPIQDYISSIINHPQPIVAITAAWVLTLSNPLAGQKAFQKWLKHEQATIRHMAAAALATTGKFGFPLILTTFQNHNDVYVKMNLALTLINQRQNCDEACKVLYTGLTTLKEKWMWEEDNNFKILTPSNLKFDEGSVPNFPEVTNQNVRLEILNILALMKYPYTQDAIKIFLQGRSWGISGQASALLLTEGDESALELVENLMQDPDQNIKVQAAFVLSLWGNGENAISVLEQSYEKADRELKERILEALGNVGSKTSIPFLVNKLSEPSQILRIVAASALLNCLYH